MFKDKKIALIIAAAGSGKRMGSGIPKQYRNIGGTPMLIRTLERFWNHGAFDVFCVVADRDWMPMAETLLKESGFSEVGLTVGGTHRHESVYRGLLALPEDVDYVVIHDAARPFVSEKIIDDTLEQVLLYNAVVVGVPAKDSILIAPGKEEGAGWASSYLNRDELVSVQTPQAFSRKLLLESMERAFASGRFGTDDGSLVLQAGFPLRVIAGEYENIKVTTREDLPMEIRVGNGFDVHQLVEGRKLILGGVEIPHEKGLLGHSDADVLTHAIMDALLGAAGEGDIGRHFPDTNKDYKDISSLFLLERVSRILKDKGCSVVNIDATLLCQRPKLAGYMEEMEKNLARVLGIDKDRVGIKATTTERLGFTGREEGIACTAVCLIHQ
jgi:2-C-methyl-D-erythritol 2,4-cyclodiphosphate synthase/2-C-methyl-D-erythritol 4-phosphate cytidylyltransferase